MVHFIKTSNVTLTTGNILYTGSKIVKGNQEAAANWMPRNKIYKKLVSPDLDPVIFFI